MSQAKRSSTHLAGIPQTGWSVVHKDLSRDQHDTPKHPRVDTRAGNFMTGCPTHHLTFLIWVIGLLLANVRAVSDEPRPRRAGPPKFDKTRVSRTFFDNVFPQTRGARPPMHEGLQSKPLDGMPQPTLPAQAATNGQAPWSRIVSATTLEDEIKALKREIDKTVTTPGEFAGRGHQAARRAFSSLACLFAVIAQYDSDVRWKTDAAGMRDQAARTAANLKAGGSIQVYQEAKKRKQDLDDLIRGSRLQLTGSPQPEWGRVVDRAILMQWLQSRLEQNLKQWTNSKTEFSSRANKLKHEAELTATIGRLLAQQGTEDADDTEYQAFCTMLEQGGTRTKQAVQTGDIGAAQQGVVQISRSCVDCHENYR